MTILSTVALIAAASIVIMGVLTFVADRGYSFDLRKQRPDGRQGGRRHEDLVQAKG